MSELGALAQETPERGEFEFSFCCRNREETQRCKKGNEDSGAGLLFCKPHSLRPPAGGALTELGGALRWQDRQDLQRLSDLHCLPGFGEQFPAPLQAVLLDRRPD